MKSRKTSLSAGARLAVLLAFACLNVAPGRANPADHSTSALAGEECKPCVLILFLYDLNKQWHVIRAATYNSLDACKTEGRRVNDDMKREINKVEQPTTSFYCLREGN